MEAISFGSSGSNRGLRTARRLSFLRVQSFTGYRYKYFKHRFLADCQFDVPKSDFSTLGRSPVRNSFQKFFPSLIRLIRECDDERNKIIHWVPKLEHEKEISFEEAMKTPFGTSMLLIPPGAKETHDERPGLTIEQLRALKEKCEFALNCATAFGIYRRAEKKEMPDKIAVRFLNDPELEPWRQIFREPVTYPPPNTHPIFRTQKARKTRRRSSRA
jgi:hypothetical protein